MAYEKELLDLLDGATSNERPIVRNGSVSFSVDLDMEMRGTTSVPTGYNRIHGNTTILVTLPDPTQVVLNLPGCIKEGKDMKDGTDWLTFSSPGPSIF